MDEINLIDFDSKTKKKTKLNARAREIIAKVS